MKLTYLLLTCFISVSTARVLMDSNRFANILLSSRYEPGTNIVFSPFSLYGALLLLHEGTNGHTDKTLQGILGNRHKSATEYSNIIREIASRISSTVGIANKVYVKKDFKIRNHFLAVARKKFYADAESVNFLERYQATKNINKWILLKTRNIIRGLLSPPELDRNVNTLLISAAYFKALWEKPFDARNTKREKFYISGTETVICNMMHNTQFFHYLSVPGAQLIKLNHEDNRFSLVIALPNSRTGIFELERNLQERQLDQLIRKFELKPVELSLPKFKIQSRLQLNDDLKQIGLGEIFDESKANFSNMVDDSILERHGNLYISTVFQKTLFQINEKGSGAATAKDLSRTVVSKPISSTSPVSFIVDHPFLFFVTATLHEDDLETDLILFMGKVQDVNIVS